ncbi:hypothetical protein [Paracidobacterium acidisoli]|uniref:Outer membrane protein beta-barrel domain-containing protein n=1 Tax=Paracidobacterium acidisoli TaxID=2303751 RepID=A0A372IMF7_9BACT|nr:hypothetical protein [Paracidobacterium acidisoli]MBT9331679.1 hypothetical protein [Paracidobacterium acidisoli]
MNGKRCFWFGLAALAALLCTLSPAALAQVQSPPPNPRLPAPAPLAGVRYDYRWEIYGGPAYSHFDAGPNLLQGANLGGFDAQAAYFFTKRWAAAANVRGYYGTSGVVANSDGIKGPFVSEHMFLGGPEYRGPSNQHVSMMFHALFGGAYGNFQHAIGDIPPGNLGLYSNQLTFGSAIGGSIDLNRSPRLVFRISPDATLVNFGGSIREQFALSVGIVYRMKHDVQLRP